MGAIGTVAQPVSNKIIAAVKIPAAGFIRASSFIETLVFEFSDDQQQQGKILLTQLSVKAWEVQKEPLLSDSFPSIYL
jgi:hypothetical protein